MNLTVVFSIGTGTLPYSNLTSFDSFKSCILFEESYNESDSTIYSDHLRRYDNHNAIANEYQIRDSWSGLKIDNLNSFISKVLNESLTITKITETINHQGYSIYCVRYKKEQS